MSKRLRALLLLCFGLLLTGCAAKFQQQSYNRTAHSELKRIAVLPMIEAKPRLFIFNNAGYNFGLIGTLIAEANRDGKEDWLQEAAAAADFDQFALMRAQLDAQMAERGYQLVWPERLAVPAKGIKLAAWGLRKNYTPRSDVDGQLDLALGFVGYACAGSGKKQPYRPTIYAAVRLLDAEGKAILFADEFVYHNVNQNVSAQIIEPDTAYTYPDFDDLKAADRTAIQGLEQAVRLVADRIAAQL